jgi:hypothetical protein
MTLTDVVLVSVKPSIVAATAVIFGLNNSICACREQNINVAVDEVKMVV